MADKIGYQSVADHGVEKRRRLTVLMWIVLGFGGIAGLLLLTVFGLIIGSHRPVMVHVTLIITNKTASPLDAAGCVDSSGDGICSVGPVAPGETRRVESQINEDDFPVGISYKQTGRTYDVRLDPDGSGDHFFEVTVYPGKVTAKWAAGRQTTTAPSTQPIQF